MNGFCGKYDTGLKCTKSILYTYFRGALSCSGGIHILLIQSVIVSFIGRWDRV